MKHHLAFGIFLLVIVSQMGCAEERPKYTSAAELREAAKPLLISVPPTKDQWASYAKSDWEFVADYLGSSNPEMSDAAVELLTKNMTNSIPHKIRASKFTEYLEPTFSPTVRMAALTYSFWGIRAGSPANRTKGTPAQSEPHQQVDERFAAMKEVWGQALNSLATDEVVSGDALYALITTMDSAGGSEKILKLLSDDNKIAFSDRLPHLFKGPEERASTAMSTLSSMGLDLAVPSLVKWYKQEKDRSARLAALTHLGLLNGSAPTHQARQAQLMPFLQMAVDDADAEIAAKVKELMK